MAFQVHIQGPVVRQSKIAASAQASREHRDFYEFRNQKASLKLVRVAQDLLIYRMENFRTYIDQNTYVTREGKPQNFFFSGQENESIQQLQHDILAILARRGRADSVVPVSTVLKAERQR